MFKMINLLQRSQTIQLTVQILFIFSNLTQITINKLNSSFVLEDFSKGVFKFRNSKFIGKNVFRAVDCQLRSSRDPVTGADHR